MLITLLIWLYTACLAFIYGYLLYQAISRILPGASGETVSPPVTILLGLAAVTTLTGYISLVSKIGLLAHGLLLAGAAASLALDWRRFKTFLRSSLAGLKGTHILAWLIFALMLSFALGKTPSEPTNYDTGLYHAQAIRWIEEYPAVPGLGNLFRNLAYNSAWFLPTALTGFAFLGGQSYHVLGGFAFAMFAWYGSLKFSALLQGKITISSLCAAGLLFLSRWLLGAELSSPGTDLPAALICWLVFLLALESLEAGPPTLPDWHLGAGLLLAVFALTIKLSLLPLILVPVFLWLMNRRQIAWRSFVQAALLCLAMVVPWAARSVIQSGYLVYPVYQVDLFNVDWKIPEKYVREDVEWIYSWPRLPGVDKSLVLAMSYREWVPGWYQNQNRNDIRLLYGLAGGLVLLVVAGVLQAARRRLDLAALGCYAVVYLIAAAGIIYWFLQAPVFRYGYAFIGISLCLLAAPLVATVLRAYRTVRLAGTAAILMILLAYYAQGVFKMRSPSYFLPILIQPTAYPAVEVRSERLGNFDVSMPVVLDQCWYAPLPCTPLHNPEVNLRGSSMAEGFYNKVAGE